MAILGEPRIQIGDYVLTEAQAMAVRVAVSNFHMETADAEYKNELGPIADAYHARLGEVLAVMLHK
jgi:hypothetical protein